MKIEVHKQGGTRKVIDIEAGATRGATIGVNVWNRDGTLFVPATGGAQPGGPPITYWSLILEIPPNVVALAETASTGLYAITGSGQSATRAIQSDTLDVVNGSGVAGNPTINTWVRRPASSSVSALRVVYEGPSGVAHLDPTDDDQAVAMLGLSVTGGSGQILVRTGGTVDDAGWSWSEGFVYVGPNGTLTQTPPVAGWEIVIGYAPSATRINLTFDEPVKLA